MSGKRGPRRQRSWPDDTRGGMYGTRVEELRAATDLVAAVDRLAEAIEANRPWMNAKEASEFLGLNRNVFATLAAAGEIPRHKPGEGAGYPYYGPELTESLLGR